MYWRIKTVDPKQLAKQWGLPAALAISLFVNVFMVATRPNPNKHLGKEQKTDFEGFAKTVAIHLVDSSYLNYEDNTKALLGGELGPAVVKKMQAGGDLPKDNLEMTAQLESLKSHRQVTAVHIREVSAGEPDPQGLVPVDVKGEVAINSADESGPSGPQPFHLQLLIGVNSGNEQPIVADLKEK